MSRVLASEPSSIARVLDQGFRLFRAGLPGVLPIALVGALSEFVRQLILPPSLRAFGVWDPQHPTPLRPGPRFLLIAVIGVVIALALHCVTLHRIAGIETGSGSARDSWRRGLQRSPRVLLATVITILLFVVLGVLLGVIVGLARALPLTGLLLLPVLIVLMAYVVVRLMYCTAEIVLRDARVWGAFATSWGLTRGRAWRVFVLLAMLFVAMGVAYVAVAATGSAAAGLLVRVAHLPVAAFRLGSALSVASMQLVIGPLGAAITLGVWHDLRMRAEGADLAARIAALPPAA